MVLQVNSAFSSAAFLLRLIVTYMPSASCGWLTRYKTWSSGCGSNWRECLPLNLCGPFLSPPVKAPGQDDGACSGWSSGHCIFWCWLQDCERCSTLITFYLVPFLSTFFLPGCSAFLLCSLSPSPRLIALAVLSRFSFSLLHTIISAAALHLRHTHTHSHTCFLCQTGSVGL